MLLDIFKKHHEYDIHTQVAFSDEVLLNTIYSIMRCCNDCLLCSRLFLPTLKRMMMQWEIFPSIGGVCTTCPRSTAAGMCLGDRLGPCFLWPYIATHPDFKTSIVVHVLHINTSITQTSTYPPGTNPLQPRLLRPDSWLSREQGERIKIRTQTSKNWDL